MNKAYISFYLKVNRIHIFVEALRCLGSPGRICFFLSIDGQTLLMRAHGRRDFISHKVPRNTYEGKRSFEISSYQLCKILAGLHEWDPACSYRVPGRLAMDAHSVLFFLNKAEAIHHDGGLRACQG